MQQVDGKTGPLPNYRCRLTIKTDKTHPTNKLVPAHALTLLIYFLIDGGVGREGPMHLTANLYLHSSTCPQLTGLSSDGILLCKVRGWRWRREGRHEYYLISSLQHQLRFFFFFQQITRMHYVFDFFFFNSSPVPSRTLAGPLPKSPLGQAKKLKRPRQPCGVQGQDWGQGGGFSVYWVKAAC